METLYAIITILFLAAVIILMILLFFTKIDKPMKSGKDSIISKKLFFPNRNTQEISTHVNDEYKLDYGGMESVNETLYDTAINVVITHVQDENVNVTAGIQDDEALSTTGVTVGRRNCSYNIKTLFIDQEGTFMIKRVNGNYVIYAGRNSRNGIKTEYGGERVNRVEFVNGTATIYVGPVRFAFTVPGAAPVASTAKSTPGGRSRFYDDEEPTGSGNGCFGGDTKTYNP